MPAVAGGQGIDVGDAVMHFLADTAELDLAYDKIDQTPERLIPVNDALQGMSTYWGQAGNSALEAGEKGIEAGQEMAEGADTARRASFEAKGELALLGEETGVKLPRHVRSFVAELPGVGTALEAAFSATAVLFLIQALVEGTKKLTDWIGETFIYTEAVKAMEKEIGASNQRILEQNKAFDASKETLRTWGFTATQVAQDNIDQLNKKIKETELAMNDAHNVIYYYNHELGQTKEQAEAAKGKILELNQTMKAQQEQLDVLQLAYQKVALAEFIAYQVALVNAAKTYGDARVQLELQQNLNLISGQQGNYFLEAALKAHSEEQLFDIEANSIRKRIKLLEEEGNQTRNERVALNAQLEALQANHDAKVIGRFNSLMDKLRDISQTPIPLINVPIPDSIQLADTSFFDKLTEAANSIGIAFSGNMVLNIDKARDALSLLKSSGVASLGDILRAQITLTNATLQYKRDLGENVDIEEKQLKNLEKQYDLLEGKSSKFHSSSHRGWQQFEKDVHEGAQSVTLMKDVGAEAWAELSSAAESAISSAILGQESFTKALEQATAQALASMASKAIVEAIYYTALGFAALAGFEDESASNYFTAAAILGGVGVTAGVAARALSSSSGTGSTSGSAASTAGASTALSAPANPVQTTNVQKFATGGLVTGPTLAIMGDSRNASGAKEAAIPLDDPDAVKSIVKALQPNGGTSGITVNVRGMISPDNLTKVVKQINRKVNKRQVSLTSSNTYRVTKRSQ